MELFQHQVISKSIIFIFDTGHKVSFETIYKGEFGKLIFIFVGASDRLLIALTVVRGLNNEDYLNYWISIYHDENIILKTGVINF